MKYFSKGKKDNSSQKADPLYIRYISDPHVGARVDKLIEDSMRLDLDYVKVDLKTFNELYSDLEKMKSFEKKLDLKNKEVEQMKQEILKYETKYNDLEKGFQTDRQLFEDEKVILLEKIKELEDNIEKRDDIIKHYEDQLKLGAEDIENLENENEELVAKYNEKHIENEELLKKLSELESELENTKKLVHIPQKAFLKGELQHVLSDKAGETLANFLDASDLINLTLLNKEIHKAINSTSTYYKKIAEKMYTKLYKTNKSFQKRLNYWGDITRGLPDAYMKHVYGKYLILRETLGEYSLKTIIQADEFFNLLLESEEKTKKSEGFLGLFGGAKTPSSSSTPSRKTSIDILSRMVIPPKDLPQEENKTETSEKNLSTESSARSVKESSDELTSNINAYLYLPTGRDVFNQYQDPYCIFIACNSMLYQKDDKKLFVAKAATAIEELMKLANRKKNILSEDKDLLGLMIQAFVKLLVHAKLLLQEGKELESIKDFLAASHEEIKEQLANFKTMFEDYNETLKNEKNLKEYFRHRCSELEGRLQSQNTELLNDSEGRIVLENKLKSIENENDQIKREKVELENKIRVLAKEFKSLRTKYSELEASYKALTDSYVDIKITFDNLQIEEDI